PPPLLLLLALGYFPLASASPAGTSAAVSAASAAVVGAALAGGLAAVAVAVARPNARRTEDCAGAGDRSSSDGDGAGEREVAPDKKVAAGDVDKVAADDVDVGAAPSFPPSPAPPCELFVPTSPIERSQLLHAVYHAQQLEHARVQQAELVVHVDTKTLREALLRDLPKLFQARMPPDCTSPPPTKAEHKLTRITKT
ncbi:hypothetical protein TeGR_g714, partial [Tetraparma gracilis]